MTAHGLVTGVLAIAVLGLGTYVVTRPVPLTDSSDPGTAGLSERLDALERRAGKSADAIRSLKRAPRRAARAAEQPAASDASEAPLPATGRIDALERRIANLEARVRSVAASSAAAVIQPVDPATLTDKELFEKAMALNGSNKVGNNPNKDFVTEAKYWEALLARDITDKQRDEGLFNLGIAYRSLKDHAKEAETFEALIELAGGIETSRGAWAGFQLGWARTYQGDDTRSLAAMDSVANSPGASRWVRYHALFRAGEFAMKLEDTARARPYFQLVVDDYGDSVPTSQRWLLDRTKQYIADIDQR